MMKRTLWGNVGQQQATDVCPREAEAWSRMRMRMRMLMLIKDEGRPNHCLVASPHTNLRIEKMPMQMTTFVCAAVLALVITVQATATPSAAVSKPSDSEAQATNIQPGQQKIQASKPARHRAKPKTARLELVNSYVFSNAVGTSVLADMRDGFESHLAAHALRVRR
jgi:hypothetical protein